MDSDRSKLLEADAYTFNPVGIGDRLLPRRNPKAKTDMLRFLADDNFNNEIVRVQDVGLAEADDPTVLE